MYPSAFYNLFPAFPVNEDVFVAMSFEAEFTSRFNYVIKPAIEAAGLHALRLDNSKTGDSIPMKILRAIAQSRLVFADITATGKFRNANVMYEVGIAHAVRRPEEVLVFRSDSDVLPFDIAPLFASSYEPGRGLPGDEAARNHVTTAIQRALGDVDLTRHLAVERVVESMDTMAFHFLAELGLSPWSERAQDRELGTSGMSTYQTAGFAKLVSLGVLRLEMSDYVTILQNLQASTASERLLFSFTPLGTAVATEFARRAFGAGNEEKASTAVAHALERTAAIGRGAPGGNAP